MVIEEIDSCEAARQTLAKLKGRDLAIICGIFITDSIGNRKQKIDRLVKLGAGAHERLVRLSRLVLLGYSAEPCVTSTQLKDMLRKNGLSTKGGKHELYMALVKNDRVPVTQIVNSIKTEDLRLIYSELLEKTPISHDSELREELLRWLDFSFPRQKPIPATPKTLFWHPGMEDKTEGETSPTVKRELAQSKPGKMEPPRDRKEPRIDRTREQGDMLQSVEKPSDAPLPVVERRTSSSFVAGLTVVAVGLAILTLGYTINDHNLLFYQLFGLAVIVIGVILPVLESTRRKPRRNAVETRASMAAEPKDESRRHSNKSYSVKNFAPFRTQSAPDPVVFLSHSLSDENLVPMVRKGVESAGAVLYVAEEDVLPGGKISEKIERQIDDCQIFIALLTPTGQGSSFVSQEIGYARAKNKAIIPLAVGDVEMKGLLADREYVRINPTDTLTSTKIVKESVARILESSE